MELRTNKNFWPGVLLGIILLTALVIRVQEFLVKKGTEDNSQSEVSANSSTENLVATSTSSTGSLITEKKYLKVIFANTPELQFKGLSGMESLGEYDGMLFEFGQTGSYTMVMREMLFPLDFIWLKGNTVTEITENAQPEPGLSERELTLYTNDYPSDSVLEVPAGFAKKQGIKVGDKLYFR